MNTGYIKSKNEFIPIYNEIGEQVNRNPNTIHPNEGIRRLKKSKTNKLKRIK